MKKKSQESVRLSELRKKAEKVVKNFTGKHRDNIPDDFNKLIEELHIYQIELEMQNEDLRRTQVELVESRRKYTDLYDNAPVGFFTMDRNGLVIDPNLTLANMLNIDRKSIAGKPFSNFIVKEFQDEFYLHRLNVFKTGENETCEIKVRRQGDEPIWVQLFSMAIMETDQGRRFCRTVLSDITNRKNTEKALKISEEQKDLLDSSITNGAFVLDRHFRYVLVTDAIEKITGMQKEKLIGMKITEVFNNFESTDYFETYKNVLQNREPAKVENKLIKRDGKDIWYETRVYPVPHGILCITNDITKQKFLENQLQIRQRMDSLGILAGGIAHDFNNILTGIMGTLELLRKNSASFNESQKQDLSEILAGCKRAADLIGRFQTLSDSSPPQRQNIDIYEIMLEVFSMLKATTDKLIEKKIDFDRDKFYLRANPSDISQVFLNLGTNAIAAIQEKGTNPGDYVRVTANEFIALPVNKFGLFEGTYIYICFEDSGVGMSEDVARQAFDPLFTTRQRSTRKGQGLGLAMVYNIISKVYSGHIYIESEVGKGTKFHIYLPMVDREATSLEPYREDPKRGDETILVVDDEELILKVVDNCLSETGYKVLKANNGFQALKLLKQNRAIIKAVILDLAMPKLSGEMVFQRLCDISPDVKVIISSGYKELYSAESILSKATAHLNKPYTLKELVRTVRDVLDQ